MSQVLCPDCAKPMDNSESRNVLLCETVGCDVILKFRSDPMMVLREGDELRVVPRSADAMTANHNEGKGD